ncbi:hypothetical protein [Wenzhouxiangella sp. EGI_FJ10305]|uniref:hypothetical protein n=1 Tax=Wenzhouxiangella sp. EGI_FJ10305 TaxID=3243768 RepID=UPI0035D5D64C
MKIVRFRTALLAVSTCLVGLLPAHATDNPLIVNAHDSVLEYPLEAKMIEDLGLEVDYDKAIRRVTDYSTLDEFDARSKKDSYISNTRRLIEKLAGFASTFDGFAITGKLMLSEYNFDEQRFSVTKFYKNDGNRLVWNLERGELDSPTYSYPPGARFGPEIDGSFRDFQRTMHYQFDWNPTVLDFDFSVDQEAKEFLDNFGREPYFVVLSTFAEDELRQGDSWVAFFFEVQCMIVYGNRPHVRTVSVNGNSVTLCEEYQESGLASTRWQDRFDDLRDAHKAYRSEEFSIDASIFDWKFSRWID